MITLSIVVPCCNEEDVLFETARRLIRLIHRLGAAGKIGVVEKEIGARAASPAVATVPTSASHADFGETAPRLVPQAKNRRNVVPL